LKAVLGPFGLIQQAVPGPFVVDFRPVFGWISDSAFGRFSTPLLGSFLTVDFGWFCPGLQFTVKRRPCLAKLRFGPGF
jgi:hypothetical protein